MLAELYQYGFISSIIFMLYIVLVMGMKVYGKFLEKDDTTIMIDAGKSGKELTKRAKNLGKDLNDLNAILVTHSHSDHTQSIGVLSRKFNIPIFMKEQTYFEVRKHIGQAKVIPFTDNIMVKDIFIESVETSHDVASCGFQIDDFALFTDTGLITDDMNSRISSSHPNPAGIIATYAVHNTRSEIWDAINQCDSYGLQLLKIRANARFDDQLAYGKWINCTTPLQINITALSTFNTTDHGGKSMCPHAYSSDEEC